jgi:hypothetical protein
LFRFALGSALVFGAPLSYAIYLLQFFLVHPPAMLVQPVPVYSLSLLNAPACTAVVLACIGLLTSAPGPRPHLEAVTSRPATTRTSRRRATSRWRASASSANAAYSDPAAARRVPCAATRVDIGAAAFVDTGGSSATIVTNRNEQAQRFALRVDGLRWVTETPPRRIDGARAGVSLSPLHQSNSTSSK